MRHRRLKGYWKLIILILFDELKVICNPYSAGSTLDVKIWRL